MLIARVFLPFVAGFYLTNLFRTINALISGQLASDLALDAVDLGLLTSVYFLTLAAVQIPIGIYLDRYGPRRVESALLLVAAGDALLIEGFVPEAAWLSDAETLTYLHSCISTRRHRVRVPGAVPDP